MLSIFPLFSRYDNVCLPLLGFFALTPDTTSLCFDFSLPVGLPESIYRPMLLHARSSSFEPSRPHSSVTLLSHCAFHPYVRLYSRVQTASFLHPLLFCDGLPPFLLVFNFPVPILTHLKSIPLPTCSDLVPLPTRSMMMTPYYQLSVMYYFVVIYPHTHIHTQTSTRCCLPLRSIYTHSDLYFDLRAHHPNGFAKRQSHPRSPLSPVPPKITHSLCPLA